MPGASILTAEQYSAIFPRASYVYLDPLCRGLSERRITDPSAVAAYCAQIGHESLDLTHFEESFLYSSQRLQQVFPYKFPTQAQAAAAVVRGPEGIAEALYGMRGDLGNTEPGDGWRYRGRGVAQLTGRRNYTRHGETLGLPLAEDPDQMTRPEIGFRSAALFAWEVGLHACESVTDYRLLTRRWNGGLVGIDDRLRRWNIARKVLALPDVAA